MSTFTHPRFGGDTQLCGLIVLGLPNKWLGATDCRHSTAQSCTYTGAFTADP